MKQKKKFLYVTLPIVILCIFSFSYKYYYCNIVTEYFQVTYYPQMVKLYSINWRYGREYYDPEVKVSINGIEIDSLETKIKTIAKIRFLTLHTLNPNLN